MSGTGHGAIPLRNPMLPYVAPPLALSEHHRAHLHGSAISDEVIGARGYVSIAPGAIADWRRIAGPIHSDKLLRTVLHAGALAFPLFRCGEQQPYTWVLRPDRPRTNAEGKPIKYEYPAKEKNILDVLPLYQPAATNPEIDLWLTEGTKKADSLASAFGNTILPVNENGVWGWRSQGRMIDDFTRFIWEGRRVVIAPDGDVRHNKHVYQAIQRSAKALLAQGVREVLIWLVPQAKDGPKIGVDDYLADGHSLNELCAHLVDLGVVNDTVRVSLMKHPVTKAPLYLPPGYDVHNKCIVRVDPDSTKMFYSGLIAVTETGRNVHTGEETATVVWQRFGTLQDTSLPRAVMAHGSRCAEQLGAAGAYVHSINAREMSRYLVEFIRENDDMLPRIDYTDRLGKVGESGLVLPAGQIGLATTTKYTGPAIQVGENFDAYPQALRQIAGDPARRVPAWSNTATLWAVFGLGLAGPAFSRLRIDRYPVLMLAKGSGSGKTTLAQFTTGAYGNPKLNPLQVQCGSGTTTPKGIQQTLVMTNGIPVHLEDVHMLMEREPQKFAGLIYDYANGQLRTYGQLNQRAGGGQELGGTLLMSGEARPQFTYEGSQRRIMLFDCVQDPPLGVPAKSSAGEARAEVLKSSWSTGAGTFGLRVCETIWSDWPAFVRDIADLQADDALRDMQAWAPILAGGMATLRAALRQLDMALNWGQMLRQWAAILAAGYHEVDPAREAFEKVLLMLGQCELVDNAASDERGKRIAATWRWLLYDRKMVAAQRVGDDCWRVLTGSPQWVALIGPGVVDRFGEEWLNKRLLRPFTGKRRVSDKVFVGPLKGSHQAILIPEEHFAAPENYEEQI